MQDAGTRQIGYDRVRGEQRGRGKKSEDKGDCIDCGLCVRVCPTGIDIRDGVNQLECVSRKKCADACDGVMGKLERPKGPVRVDTETRLTTRLESGELPARAPLIRPRTALYSLLALSLFSYGAYAFVNHETLIVRVVPTTRGPFVQHGDKLRNLFTIKVGNQSSGERS